VLTEPSAATNTLAGSSEIKLIADCKHAGGYTVTLEAICVPPKVGLAAMKLQIVLEPPP